MTTLLTIPQALERLPVGRTTLYKLFRTGKLTPRKLEGRTAVAAEDLETYIASTIRPVSVRPTAQPVEAGRRG